MKKSELKQIVNECIVEVMEQMNEGALSDMWNKSKAKRAAKRKEKQNAIDAGIKNTYHRNQSGQTQAAQERLNRNMSLAKYK
jgi:hypothetical protein